MTRKAKQVPLVRIKEILRSVAHAAMRLRSESERGGTGDACTHRTTFNISNLFVIVQV